MKYPYALLSSADLSVAVAIQPASALEVTTAREAGDKVAPFNIKLDATSAAMQAAYNDLMGKHNALQAQHDALQNQVNALTTRVTKSESCAKQGKLFNGSQCVDAPGVPVGTVVMFKKSCPSGWVRDSAWDGRFPRGAGSFGGTGGATSAKLSSGHLPKHRLTIKGRRVRLVKSASSDKHATIGVFDADMGSNAANFCTEYYGSNKAFSLQNPYRNTVFCRKK